MRYEVDEIGTIEPGLSYGHRWRVIGDDDDTLISGWASGARKRATDAAKDAMGKLARAREGRGTMIRRIIMSSGHIGLPERQAG